MIILASASPRRSELLKQIDCDFKVEVAEVEEVSGDDLSPEELCVVNARLKAQAVSKLYPDIPVLGADTVVSLDGHIYGKPKDAEDACAMLGLLSGKKHLVTTGIAFAWNGVSWVDYDDTWVYFADMTNEQITRYVNTGEPLDKAGSYGIQGRAAAYIKKIDGSYSNVVGLPLHSTLKLAEKAGIDLYGNYGTGLAVHGKTEGKTAL